MKYKEMIEKALKKSTYSPLSYVIQYSLETGGKRIRPILTLAFCEAYGGDINEALPVAVAVEMLHTSTLIQDDLPCMDDDDLRRGQPSCHKMFSEADTILAASKMTYEAIDKIENLRIVKMLCHAMANVYDGQKSDLFYPKETLRIEQILQIYELKTCALIQAACVSGVLAAGADEEAVGNAHDYGRNLGLAFQLIDDILDNEAYENAKNDADEYTQRALKLLENVPNNEFLIELTNKLLNRSN
jgi:geranylgeranyl diphosphate synthase type II